MLCLSVELSIKVGVYTSEDDHSLLDFLKWYSDCACLLLVIVYLYVFTPILEYVQ